MTLPIRTLATILFLALYVLPASAQVPTGTPPFGSFAGGPDILNLANLNSHITVPVLHKPDRGTNFDYDLSYDSSVWYPVTSGSTTTWQPVLNWGWRGQTEVATGYLSYSQRTTNCGCTFDHGVCIPKGQTITDFNFVYHDNFGVPHAFLGDAQAKWGSCGSATPSLTVTATDGSGYTLQFTGPATITYPNGEIINPPINNSAGAATATDRNGNQISVSSTGVFTDTLGTTALTVSQSAPSPTTPVTFTYTAPSGASAAYTMKYSALTVQTKFACSGISDYGPTANNLVTEIDLPDILVNPNDKYTFTYEPTPGVPANVTGRLASVTLPTGGTITYTYNNGNITGSAASNGIVCADGSTAGFTRQTPDGTWTYARALGTGAASTTTITDPERDILAPNGNDTVIQFQGLYETQRQTYQGSLASGTLLKTVNTCYNASTVPCTGTAVTLPITQRDITDIYPSNILCLHTYKYNSFGMLTNQFDHDYGPPGSTPLIRETDITFAALGNNISAFQQTVTVKDGSGTAVAAPLTLLSCRSRCGRGRRCANCWPGGSACACRCGRRGGICGMGA